MRRFGGMAGWFIAFAIGFATMGNARAEVPRVVVSVLPVHSLVASVMTDVGTPHLLVRGAASPHSFSLRPSDARAVADADLVIWVGPALESFLPRLLKSKPAASVVTLMEQPAVHVLAGREGGVWTSHHHDGHDGHDDHEHEAEHDSGAHHDGDPHIWLDPRNARAIVRVAAARLAAIDPDNASAYAANAARAARHLAEVEKNLERLVSGVRDRPFIVFHDAYQYFETRFGLRAAGSLTIGPERKPGARRVRALRTEIVERKAVCVFAEPQFEPDLVATLVAGTDARTAVLDPIGAGLAPGPEAYETLLMHLAKAFRDCLSSR